ncbi:ribosomal RNA processing protein 36 homolog [Parambassis ranga]|uniref:rRNA biogenesis protein RRP36 n=1 Tax=Parambassis ranga TaxID=210632 RepID=A0A6P7HTB3_9TELE|nr:ribosomal RNA processing protein 36 homolog [Parambassis ranga]
MKGKEKQKHKMVLSQKKAVTSSEDEDSDVEKNFDLLNSSGGVKEWTEEDELYLGGEEEEEEESDSDEEEGSDDGGEGEEEDKEKEDGNGETSEEEDSDDDEDDEHDEDQAHAGGSTELKTKEDIRKELSTMSFEDIRKLQNQVGTKVYNEVAYGSSKSRETGKKKRLNKNRPMEISAKRSVPYLRQVVPIKKATQRDPRFDDLSGEYKPDIFEKTYKFINDIKHREKEIVQKQLKKTKKSNQKKEKLMFLLKRMENQERERKSREQQREKELQFKRQQRERASQGAQPFFFKKSEKKKLQLAEKYQELKKSGKLENFLSKKRKRNAGKDRRKLPRQLQHKKSS